MSRKVFYLTLSLLFVALTTKSSGQTASEAKAQWVYLHAAISLQENVPTPSPEPDEPVTDTCPNCGGTGKLGDGQGRVTCPVCEGTGKITKDTAELRGYGWPPKPLVSIQPLTVSQEKDGVIEAWTSPSCPACPALKAVLPEATSRGWKVIHHENATGRVPRYMIWINGKARLVVGFGGRASFNRDLQQANLLGKTSMSSNSYTPRWTWPGELYDHLLQPPHSIDTATWTQDQREKYHDDWHDRYGMR